jgi:hypothetical protein
LRWLAMTSAAKAAMRQRGCGTAEAVPLSKTPFHGCRDSFEIFQRSSGLTG